MLNKKPELKVYGNDINPYLIEMFKALNKGWTPPLNMTKEEWLYIKQNKDEYPYLTAFAGYGCSYGGNWFCSYANTSGRNYCREAYKSIMNDIGELNRINWCCYDYKQFPLPEDPCLIYCDIPYKGTENSRYCLNNHIEFNYDEFWSWADNTAAKGHTVIVSEYYGNIRTTKYAYNIIWSKDSKAGLRGNKDRSVNTIEVLVKV